MYLACYSKFDHKLVASFPLTDIVFSKILQSLLNRGQPSWLDTYELEDKEILILADFEIWVENKHGLQWYVQDFR